MRQQIVQWTRVAKKQPTAQEINSQQQTKGSLKPDY